MKGEREGERKRERKKGKKERKGERKIPCTFCWVAANDNILQNSNMLSWPGY
jgi:hypothetical protein